MIHITFSDSSAGSIKYGIKGEKIIINLRDNLSQGPIGTDINYEMRKNWILTVSNDEEKNDMESHIKEGYENFFNAITKIKKEDKVCIWVGNNSFEQCGLMYVLTKLNRFKNIYIVNISNVILNEGEFNEYTPRAVGEIMAEKLNIIYGKEQQPLSPETFHELTNCWSKLVKENSKLRVFKNGKVISVDESFYDVDILKTTMKLSKGECRKCARVIGEVLGYSDDFISDDYIFWRVKELIKEGKLSYNGDQRAMRYLEIK